MIYGIPCNSFDYGIPERKNYFVVLNFNDSIAVCNCKFFMKYGRDHNEPCKHILIVIASFKIAMEYGLVIERYLLTKKKYRAIMNKLRSRHK